METPFIHQATRRMVRDGQSSFIGGLNTAADESAIGEAQVREALNCRLSQYGALEKRGGTRRMHTSFTFTGATGPPPCGMLWANNLGVPANVVVSNNHVFTDAGWSAPPMIPPTDRGALAAFAGNTLLPPGLAAFRDGAADCVYIANAAVGGISKYKAGTLTNNLAGTPQVQVLAVFNRRLFGTLDPNNPYRLYWSGLDNGDSLGVVGSGGGNADIRTFGWAIQGLLPIGASLIIAHTNGLSRFTGWSQDDIAIDSGTEGISSDIGTVCPASLIAVENVGYIATNRGIYAITPTSVSSISMPVEDVWRRNGTNSGVFAVHQPVFREIWFWDPSKTGFYAYNYAAQAWTGPLQSPLVPSIQDCAWSSVDVTGLPHVAVVGDDGILREWDYRTDLTTTYTDDVLADGTGGSAFLTQVQTRRFYAGDPESDKSWRWITQQRTTLATGTSIVEQFLPTGVQTPLGVGANLTGDRLITSPAVGVSNWCRLLLNDNAQSSGPWSVSGVGIQARDYGYRRD